MSGRESVGDDHKVFGRGIGAFQESYREQSEEILYQQSEERRYLTTAAHSAVVFAQVR